MEYIDDMPVMDYNEVVDFIAKNSGYSPDVVGRVLELETEFMIQAGIIKIEEDKGTPS